MQIGVFDGKAHHVGHAAQELFVLQAQVAVAPSVPHHQGADHLAVHFQGNAHPGSRLQRAGLHSQIFAEAAIVVGQHHLALAEHVIIEIVLPVEGFRRHRLAGAAVIYKLDRPLIVMGDDQFGLIIGVDFAQFAVKYTQDGFEIPGAENLPAKGCEILQKLIRPFSGGGEMF